MIVAYVGDCTEKSELLFSHLIEYNFCNILGEKFNNVY